ncbi:MAG: ABC transporter substrate-binding protein [Clostridia bacterium]|nr:ABC transporter substrate-binding protein [Clostridia bacterium]
MKRLLSVFLALVLMSAVCVSAAGEESVFPDELTVGNTTQLSGNFTTTLWGNNTADLDVKALLCGYNLIDWDEGLCNFKPAENAVTGISAVNNKDGSRSYWITLYDDLLWSDGTRITAADYAFALMLSVMPQIGELSGSTNHYGWIAGLRDWAEGNADTVTGIRIIGEDTLKLTVTADYVPFFYELGLLMCDPMPASLLAPDTEITDDGSGAYLKNAPSVEALRAALLDEETGYLTHPQVVSGPYTLTSFDGTTAIFEANPYFKGDTDGRLPGIPRLIYTLADNDTMIGKLADGEFGLLNKCVRADTIDDGLKLVTSDTARMQAYPRTGESYIAFMCEKDTVSDSSIRKAIAYCLDKDALVSDYSGNYALRADGYYGIGQWMYMAVSGLVKPFDEPAEDASEEELAEYDENSALLEEMTLDNVTVYDPDHQKAVTLLEEAGWTLNRNGEAFDPESDDVRCKEIAGELRALDLTLAYPEGNQIGELLEKHFLPYLADAGILVQLVPVPWTELLEQYDRRAERNWDMIYLATNYEVVFDPTPEFDPADAQTGVGNRTAIADTALYEKAADMARTEPGDFLGYLGKWVSFEETFAEVLPMIPVYCNTYFDFYTPILQDYAITSGVTWSQAIMSAYYGDPLLETDTTGNFEELNDD